MKEKEIVLNSALQKLSDSLMAKHSAVLPVEYAIRTVRMERYLKIAMADMLSTGPNVTAAECACTIALQTISLLKMESYMEYAHAVEFALKSVRTVWTDGNLKNQNNSI